MRCNAGIALTLFNSIFNRFRLITILLGTLIVHEFFSGFSSLHVHYYIVYIHTRTATLVRAQSDTPYIHR